MIAYPEIDPIAVSIGPINIAWYGLTYVAGLAFAWWLGRKRSRSPGAAVAEDQIDDLIFYAALGIILGGRLGYIIFYGWSGLVADPLRLFRVWEGGMAFHGGFIGVVVAMLLFCRRHKLSIPAVMDFIAPLAPIGLALGRLGNFINQELWGRPTDVPWAMVFPKDPLGLARHPSQLYQFALEGVLLFLMVYWFTRQPRPTWSAAGLFLFGYGLLRSFSEFFRQPDAHIGFEAFGWLTRGQLLSIPMLVGGLLLMIWAYRRQPSN
jgi:phosphatidylglycerol:prolipoprotein diacylglycerol transferase